jgi:hypothetical protein
VGYDLARVGAQLQTAELSERAVFCWVWIFGTNGGQRLSFTWSGEGRYLFPGGAPQLRAALDNLAELGWVRLEEDPESGRCTVVPTPGDALITG